MKPIIFCLLILASLSNISAQVYNNEWIDYAKTYYKFKVTTKGLHRISQPILQAAGIASTPAQQFQLFRNGVQVPLFITIPTGTLGASDYIEFCGTPNDGATDTQLYNQPGNQPSRAFSLYNDTAFYFLTINTNTAQNLRLTNTINNVAGNVLPSQANFMYTLGLYEKARANQGFAAVVGEDLHASDYDKGEGWSTNLLYAGNTHSRTVSNLFPDLSSTATATYNISASGNALYTRTVRSVINGNQVSNPSMDYFSNINNNTNFPVSFLTSGSFAVGVTNVSSTGNDRMVIAQQEITYPRLFNFGGESYFEFSLAANAANSYIEISNFNGGTNPILYDLTNGRRYIPVNIAGILRIVLQPSTTVARLVMVNTTTANITAVSGLQNRSFTNFMAAANQGDYILLTSRYLHNSTAPTNCVEKYKAYRSSPAGGNFNTIIVDCDDLYDQYSFGIPKHPVALRNYLRQARNIFSVAPKNVLLIGRAVCYNEVLDNASQTAFLDVLNTVPTFGFPASDNLLTANPGTSVQTTPIGRLGAIYATEVDAYLEKLKEYEAKQVDNIWTIDNKLWMKNGTFVSGSSDPFLQGIIDGYHTTYMNTMWQDTSIGGKGNLFTKTQAGGVVPLTNSFMESLWNSGHSVLEYFGHSSSTALEFNIDDPNVYTNQGKYPIMVINGCLAGNYFGFNPFRITTSTNLSLSEKFSFSPNRGSMAFVASTSFGVVNYLNYYNAAFFNSLRTTQYTKTLGELMRSSGQGMLNLTGVTDYYSRIHAQQILLQGDPAIKPNVSYPKPDYVIEPQTLKINPNFISIAENSFTAKMVYYNLGKAIPDSININVKRQYPDGSTQTIYNQRVKATYYADSLSFNFAIVPLRDKGLNRIIIKVDGDNERSEMSEINNTVTKEVFIFEDEARPVHPYNYAIVNTLPLKLVASTANALAPNRTYNMELDSTENFNSPIKTSQSLTQVGGMLEFTPIASLIPNTVYYWRVSVAGTSPVIWNKFSFTYLPTSTYGYNQGHYFQHLNSNYTNMRLDSASRTFIFDSTGVNLTLRNGVWPTANFEEVHSSISVNQDPYIRGICIANHIAFNVFNPITGKPWFNASTGNAGQYSSDATCGPGREYNFNFDINSSVGRKNAMDFIDLIPVGHYITLRNTSKKPWWFGTPQDKYISDWQADQNIYGVGNSLYHKIKNLGLNTIDSFYKDRAFIYVVRKGMNSIFPPKQVVSEGDLDRISLSTDFTVPRTTGTIVSPLFGPAKNWREVHWRGAAMENTIGDVPVVKVLGVRANGQTDTLFNLNISQLDYSLSSVSAITYPYIKLMLVNQDLVTATPWQLNYWRLNYDPVPEGAIAPNITLQIKDTLDAGEPMQVKVAFKNVSFVPFDSVKVKLTVLDAGNNLINYTMPKQKPLIVGEVLTLDYTLPTTNIIGANSIFVEFNPDDDQPEQYRFNNFLYKSFFVRADNFNPLLDVTFDGIHIINKDIVSSNPNILIKLKDESKYLALNNPNDLKVQLRYPGSSLLVNYNWNTDTLQFTPGTAGANSDNTATAMFRPKNLPDGIYELIVKGKDRSGNASGELEYKILFTVINKAMISNMLNYPNPFTTSTAFVFTLTGNEVPQNIKIEIMTITGKIVREITKAELGPLRIGRNITEYKWDGTDSYGAKLANGTYLYRVVTNLNGKSLDKFKVGSDDKTDQYFKAGYGKMVILR